MKRALLALGLATLIVQHGTDRVRAVPTAGDALQFFKSHFVTGDYTVGGVGMYGTGSGVITIDDPNLNKPSVDVVAAYLYWQMVVPNNADPTVGGTGVTFNTYTLSTTQGSYGKVLGSGTPTCSSAGGGAGAANGSKRTYSYRADVLRFLDVEPLPPDGTGKTVANGEHTITLPTSGGLSPLGASLVVIYRDASLPLSAFVMYDGTYAMDQTTEQMQLTIEGFYDADGAANGSRMTHIVGSGQANKSELLYYNGDPIAENPFRSVDGNLWDTYTTDPFTANAGPASVTTAVDHAGFNSFDCLTWAAVVYKTTVTDTDGDGLLNRWETATATAPVKDPYGRDLPYLADMGADPIVKDLFIEIGYLKTDGFSDDGNPANDPTMTYGGVAKPGHMHRPGHQALKLMGDALWNAPLAAQRIKVHFDVGDGYPAGDALDPSKNADEYIIRGAGLARGGEVVDESFTQCTPTSAVPWDCQFSDYPGTVGWKTGYQYLRDQILARPSPAPPPPALDPCDDPFSTSYGSCTRRFDPNRINIFHYALFAHSVGLPESEIPCLSGDVGAGDLCSGGLADINPAFRRPRTNTGLGDFPGGDILVTMGGFNDLSGLPVGTPFMQASTLMHEFGHNALRRHGGEAFEPNCRPTYLSVMNYMYQLRGLPDDDGIPHLDFSREVGGPSGGLNELALDRLDGVYKRYRIGWYAPLVGSYLEGRPGTRPARAHCNGSPITDGAQMVRIDARQADPTGGTATNFPIDWDADGDPGTVVTVQDVNFSGLAEGPYPAAAATTDWDALDLRQIGSRRSPGGWYVDTDGTLALGPLSILSGKGDAGKGDAGKGDAGKGDAGKGDAGKGDAGKGDAGGLSGKGDAGKGDAGGGDLFDSNDPRLPGGELDAKLAADLGVAAPTAFNAVVIDALGTANHHDVQLTWKASNEGNAQHFIVYRVEGADVANDEDWTQVGAVVPFVLGQADYSTIDTASLAGGASYTYFAVAVYPDLTTPAPGDAITSEPSRRVTIEAVNDPARAGNDGYSTNEDTPLTVAAAAGVLANDGDPDDTETLTAVLVAGPSNGVLTLNADGGFTYTPAANYSGSDTFTYKARATYGTPAATVDSNVATVTIDIAPVNDVPTISNITDRSIDYNGTSGPIAFVVGDDGDTATLTLTALSSNAALVPEANVVFGGSGAARTVTVTPAANNSGTSTITVRVTDSGGLTASDTFVVTVVGPATFFNVQNAPATPPKSFKTGSAVPMKWQYKHGTAVVNSAALGHTVTVVGNGLNEVITNAAPGGSSFSYSTSTNTWQFNLQTKFGANLINYPVGTYTVTVTPTGPQAAGFLGSTFTMTLVK